MLRRNQIKNLFKVLGEFTRREEWYNFRCPFHKGDGFHFGINLQTSWYSCWVCGENGQLYDLPEKLRRYTSLDVETPLRTYGIYPTPGIKEGIPPVQFKRLNESGLTSMYPGDIREGIPEARRDISKIGTENWGVKVPIGGAKVSPGYFRTHFQYIQDVPTSIGKKCAVRYLKRRGIRGSNKIVGMLGEYPGRIIFPFVKNGSIIYFQARSFVNIPLKMLNPNEIDGWLPKSEVLWAYDWIYKHKGDIVCLTEGIFDAYSIWVYIGIPSTSLLGKTISTAQIDLLRKAGIKEVIVFLDADAMLEAVKLAVLLYNRKFHVRLVMWRIEDTKPNDDPNSLSSLQMKKLILESVEITPESEILLPLEYV